MGMRAKSSCVSTYIRYTIVSFLASDLIFMSHSPLRRRFVLALPALAVLSACSAEQEFGIPTKQALSMSAIEQYATGFDAGSKTSTRRVFVFFDPQCPHCARFWEETKSLALQARFTWIPVHLMNRASIAQGATILAAGSPLQAMEEHETAFLASGGRGGITAADVPVQFRAAVTKNTRLFESFDLRGVPLIVGQNVKTGALYSHQGGMPAVQLAQRLGW